MLATALTQPRLRAAMALVFAILLCLGVLFYLAYTTRTFAQTSAEPVAWQQASQGLPQGDPFKLFFSPAYPTDEQVFATHPLRGTYRARRAQNWELLDPHVTLLAVSPNFAADQTLLGGKWISSVYNVVRSIDGGETWQPVWVDPPEDLAVRFSPDFVNDQTVYVASSHVDQGGVWRSTNGGATWNPAQQLLTPVLGGNVNYGVEVLLLSPQFAADHTLWAVTHNQMIFNGGSYTPYSGYLYRSVNGGDTWQAFGQAAYNGSDYNLLDIEPSPNYAADHTLWAVSEIPDSLPDEGLLWTSSDYGATWQQLPEQPPMWHSGAADFPDLLVFSPAYSSDHTLYFSSNAGVYRSPDNGASWQPFGSFTSFYDWWSYIAPSPTYASDHLVFITVAEGLYWTDDGGSTWTYVELSALDGHALALSSNYAADQNSLDGAGSRRGVCLARRWGYLGAHRAAQQ